MGHGLGFGHHTDPQATMYESLGAHAPRGAALGTTDKTCAEYAYHTFLDVPYNYWAWNFVESIETQGITLGCGVGVFCPDDPVSRAQIAVFLLRGRYGSNFQPPTPTGTMFQDVPADFWAAAFIEKLSSDGITRGCDQFNFCPNRALLRSEMAVFLLAPSTAPAYTPAAGHRHAFRRRAAGLLGPRLDRAARGGGDHRRLRQRQLLPGGRRLPGPDGRLPGAAVHPAAALREA